MRESRVWRRWTHCNDWFAPLVAGRSGLIAHRLRQVCRHLCHERPVRRDGDLQDDAVRGSVNRLGSVSLVLLSSCSSAVSLFSYSPVFSFPFSAHCSSLFLLRRTSLLFSFLLFLLNLFSLRLPAPPLARCRDRRRRQDLHRSRRRVRGLQQHPKPRVKLLRPTLKHPKPYAGNQKANAVASPQRQRSREAQAPPCPTSGTKEMIKPV